MKAVLIAAVAMLFGHALISAEAAPSVDKLASGVRLHLADGSSVQVEIYSDEIVHITAQPMGAPPQKPSFVVIGKWNAPSFQFEISATTDLPAHTTVQVAIHGGGPGIHLFAAASDPNRSTFRSAVGDGVNYWFIYGPELDDVIAGYRQATGAVPLFLEWAYGYWQCRERYSSQKQTL